MTELEPNLCHVDSSQQVLDMSKEQKYLVRQLSVVDYLVLRSSPIFQIKLNQQGIDQYQLYTVMSYNLLGDQQVGYSPWPKCP